MKRTENSAFTIDPATIIGDVTLGVADLSLMMRYYEQVIGLRRHRQAADWAELGGPERPFLRLESRPEGRAYPQATGLFHLAILVPSRADLGQWLKHYVNSEQKMIDGAGDHNVSEALYLTDPEGNGLEIYRDRPRAEWEYRDGRIHMVTLAVDLPAVAAAAPDTPFSGLPAQTTLGHIHLQVRNIPETNQFYSEDLGFGFMAAMPSASFFGAGGYHHHIGANTWHSQAAAPPPPGSRGLLHFSVLLPDLAARDALMDRLDSLDYAVEMGTDDPNILDPSGIKVTLKIAAS